jgi:hypothetical protein
LAATFKIDVIQVGFWTADLSHPDRKSRHNSLLYPFWRDVKNALFWIEDDEWAIC